MTANYGDNLFSTYNDRTLCLDGKRRTFRASSKKFGSVDGFVNVLIKTAEGGYLIRRVTGWVKNEVFYPYPDGLYAHLIQFNDEHDPIPND